MLDAFTPLVVTSLASVGWVRWTETSPGPALSAYRGPCSTWGMNSEGMLGVGQEGVVPDPRRVAANNIEEMVHS